MLTAKHIDSGGNEYIYPAFTVELRKGPNENEPKINDSKKYDKLVLLSEARFVIAEIYNGTTFIMNEQGQTVSRYDLGPSNIQLDSIALETYKDK